MRAVFDRHADCNEGQGLSAAALMAALQEVQAPAALSSCSSAQDVLHRADDNLGGFVNFEGCDSHVCGQGWCWLTRFSKVFARSSVTGRLGDAAGGGPPVGSNSRPHVHVLSAVLRFFLCRFSLLLFGRVLRVAAAL